MNGRVKRSEYYKWILGFFFFFLYSSTKRRRLHQLKKDLSFAYRKDTGDDGLTHLDSKNRSFIPGGTKEFSLYFKKKC